MTGWLTDGTMNFDIGRNDGGLFFAGSVDEVALYKVDPSLSQ